MADTLEQRVATLEREVRGLNARLDQAEPRIEATEQDLQGIPALIKAEFRLVESRERSKTDRTPGRERLLSGDNRRVVDKRVDRFGRTEARANIRHDGHCVSGHMTDRPAKRTGTRCPRLATRRRDESCARGRRQLRYGFGGSRSCCGA